MVKLLNLFWYFDPNFPQMHEEGIKGCDKIAIETSNLANEYSRIKKL